MAKVFFLSYAQMASSSAVLTKVVPQKRKSVRDNADWYFGYKEFAFYWLRITELTNK